MGKSANPIITHIKEKSERYGLSLIPVKLGAPEKDGVRYGKVPTIGGWTDYCAKIPTEVEIDSWSMNGEPTGIGIVCGEASNICCIDIDTEDPELIDDIVKLLPWSAPCIEGRKGRGGKYLFKLKEYDAETIPFNFSKKTLGDRAVDVMISGCQIVAPPSIHSKKDGKVISMYKWSKDSNIPDGEYPSEEQLPVLTTFLLDSIEKVVNSKSRSQQVELNMLPLGGLKLDKEKEKGRYNRMRAQIANMIKAGTGVDDAVPELLRLDEAWNGLEESVFSDKIKATRSRELNAAKWYVDQLISVSKGKDVKSIEIPLAWTKGKKKRVVLDAEGWVRPILPESSQITIPPFDNEVIPDVWRDLIVEMSETNNIPIEACLMAHLAPLSSVIGNKKIIVAKKNDKGWREAHNIWYAYVSRSGTRKTQMIRLAMYGLRELQKRADETYDKLKREVNLDIEMLSPQISELEKRIKETSVQLLDGDGSEEYLKDLQLKKEKLENQIKDPPRRQVIINSVTTEKLLTIMANNPSGSCMVFNELSELLDMCNKRGLEVMRKVVMNAWDGLDPYRHETKGNGDILIDKMCLTVFGAIQPSLFKKELAKIYHGNGDDGLFQRFFIVYNNIDKAPEAVDLSFSHARYYKAYEIFHKAYDLPDDANEVILSKGAYDLYMEYETYTNAMAKSEEVSAIASFWSKNTGKIVKMASLIEFLENNGQDHDVISESSFIKAKYLMERQAAHIRLCFPDESTEGLNEVISMIQSGIIQDGVTMYQLQRSHYKYFGKVKLRNKIMRELEDRCCIKTEKVGQSSIIKINPYLF